MTDQPTPSHHSPHDPAVTHPSDDRVLVFFLKFIAATTLFAIPAALMPAGWMIEIGQWLGMKPFPDAPLTFYLARNLSILYAMLGAVLWIVASDLTRYRPLIRWFAILTIGFGVMQWIVDTQSGMPAWWTYGESLSTICGGMLIYWLDRQTPSS